MPLKQIIIILCLVGLGALIKPDWTMVFIWMGGMALLWMITGQWVPPSNRPKTPDQTASSEAEDIRPTEASMEADDIDDLTRMDGEQPLAAAEEDAGKNLDAHR